jgi:hypothetical protein
VPEVSVNPHMQSSVQANNDQLTYSHEPTQNGLLNDHIRSQSRENYFILNSNSGETHTNHHHIQVEPTNTLKRTSSPIKSSQIIDVQPNIIVQHQRPTSRPNSAANILTKDPLNEAYIERDNTRTHLLNVESRHTNNDNDSTSTLKQYENQQKGNKNPPNLSTPPPSPSSKELNRIWKKQRNKYSFRSATAGIVTRRNTKNHRPPGRLKNYGDDSESETTATETPSREEGK